MINKQKEAHISKYLDQYVHDFLAIRKDRKRVCYPSADLFWCTDIKRPECPDELFIGDVYAYDVIEFLYSALKCAEEIKTKQQIEKFESNRKINTLYKEIDALQIIIVNSGESTLARYLEYVINKELVAAKDEKRRGEESMSTAFSQGFSHGEINGYIRGLKFALNLHSHVCDDDDDDDDEL